MSVMSLFDDKLPAMGVVLTSHLYVTSCLCKATRANVLCFASLSYDELFL
jgi:hypothetical protein